MSETLSQLTELIRVVEGQAELIHRLQNDNMALQERIARIEHYYMESSEAENKFAESFKVDDLENRINNLETQVDNIEGEL